MLWCLIIESQSSPSLVSSGCWTFLASEVAMVGRKKSRDRTVLPMTLLLLTQELETQSLLWETLASHSCPCLTKLIIKFNPFALTGTSFSWKLHLQSTSIFGLTSQRGKSSFSSMRDKGFCSHCKAITNYWLRIYFLAFICRVLLCAEVFACMKIFVKDKKGWRIFLSQE